MENYFKKINLIISSRKIHLIDLNANKARSNTKSTQILLILSIVMNLSISRVILNNLCALSTIAF